MTTKKKKPRNSASQIHQKSVPPKPGVDGNGDGVESPIVPIIGIGASAGGLEALEAFFSKVPGDCHMAFVVLQHFAPGHKSMMDSLLAKYTGMAIETVAEGMEIRPDTIYLTPAGHNVEIAGNRFRLSQAGDVRAGNLPIDHFFRSLAQSRGEKAVGIVLSGTGADGTLGLKAIKAADGMAMAQEEAQAKYPGMPRSAIETGLVDFVLPVEKMPDALARYVRHPFVSSPPVSRPAASEQDALKRVLNLLKSRTGHDFSEYKQTTIRRRIERRMAVNAIDDLSDYGKLLERDPDEQRSLFGDLLIGVTRFFRDPEAFEALAKKALERDLADKKADKDYRVWVVGCSTGEEAYSLAILLTELIEKYGGKANLQIFASDIDPHAIDAARRGVYPAAIEQDVSPKRLERFFTRTDTAYSIKKPIRDRIVFSLQDITKDPPFSRINLLSCRNLLIYMERDLQKRVLPLFHYSLVDGGVLFMGTSETVGDFAEDFKVIDSRNKIFRKSGTASAAADQLRMHDRLPLLEPAPHALQNEAASRALGARVLVEQYAPPSVLVDERFEVRQFYGEVDRFLSFGSGKASLNALQIARNGLRPKLAAALSRAMKENGIVTARDVRIRNPGEQLTVDLVVQPLSEPGTARRLMLVVFKEKGRLRTTAKTPGENASAKKRANATEALEQELKATKEYLQTTIEELQTSNEELRSTNEEMQSSNEELESSREELQSTNEELVTVNGELQNKVEELTRTSNDLNNLLASTDIATVFVDTELRIKRFTPKAVAVFHLQEGDTGRPMRDITSEIVSFDIYAAAADTLATLTRKDVEVAARGGKWYAVRIMPYRTVDFTIDGVVLTFSEVTALKKALEGFESVESLADGIVKSIRSPFLVLDGELRVHAANDPFYAFFRVIPRETIGKPIQTLGSGQWNIPVLKRALEEILEKNKGLEDFVVEYDFPQIGRKKVLLNGKRIEGSKFVYLSVEEAAEKRP